MNAVFITGASGFIGASVLQALRAVSPRRPLLLAGRRPDALADLPDARRVFLDLTSDQQQLPVGVHSVLHLAGEKRAVAAMQAVNHHGAVRLVEAAARAGARRFVHLSSVGVYGAPKHAGRVDESHAHTPRNPYESSKSAGERAVRERCAALGLSCVVLQPSNVIGIVEGRSYPLLGLAQAVARGRFCFIGRTEARVNDVAVEDVAAALVAALAEDAPTGVYIVNTPATLRQLVGWIASELGVPAPVRQLPMAVGTTAAALGTLARRLLRHELPLTPERLLELTNTTTYDGGAITRALGFAYPLGLEAALRGMMRRYRAEGRV